MLYKPNAFAFQQKSPAGMCATSFLVGEFTQAFHINRHTWIPIIANATAFISHKRGKYTEASKPRRIIGPPSRGVVLNSNYQIRCKDWRASWVGSGPLVGMIVP